MRVTVLVGLAAGDRVRTPDGPGEVLGGPWFLGLGIGRWRAVNYLVRVEGLAGVDDDEFHEGWYNREELTPCA